MQDWSQILGDAGLWERVLGAVCQSRPITGLGLRIYSSDPEQETCKLAAVLGHPGASSPGTWEASEHHSKSSFGLPFDLLPEDTAMTSPQSS